MKPGMAKQRTITLLTAAVLVLCTSSPSSALSCYDATGNQNDGMGLCNPGASVSVCCGWTDICYSNGLCRTTKNGTVTAFFNNGCTDSALDAPECAPIADCKRSE